MSTTGVKASIRQLQLKQLISRAAGALGRQYPYVLLQFYLTRIVCTATDTQITIIAENNNLDDTRIDCGGAVCIPAKAFIELISALPDSQIELLELPNNSLQVTCGDYAGVVPGVDWLNHFPQIPVVESDSEIRIDGHELGAMYHASVHAAAKKGKPNLMGLNLTSSTTGLCCTATDGHRLSISSRDISVEGADAPHLAKNITIPAHAFEQLSKITSSCTLRIDDSRLSVESNNTTLLIQLIADEYPDYRRVVPVDQPGCAVINAAELATVIERVNILSESDGILLDIDPGADGNGDIRISATNKAGEISDLVAAEITGSPVKVRIHPQYLLESLRSLKGSEDIIIKYSGELSPIVLLPCDHSGWNERLEIIMPKRLG